MEEATDDSPVLVRRLSSSTLLACSTSRWGVEHIRFFELYEFPRTTKQLSFLKPWHQEYCYCCRPDAPGADCHNLVPSAIKALVQDFPKVTDTQSLHQIYQTVDPQISDLVRAYAEATRPFQTAFLVSDSQEEVDFHELEMGEAEQEGPELPSPSLPPRKRARPTRTAQQSLHLDGDQAEATARLDELLGPATSSPARGEQPHHFSSQSFSSQPEADAAESFDDRCYLAEGTTLRLLQAFINYVLNRCWAQSKWDWKEVQLRHDPASRTIVVPHCMSSRMESRDDGGIRQMSRDGDGPWVVADDAMAIIEAKRAFAGLDVRNNPDDKTAKGRELVAQCLGEAVATYLERPDQSSNHVFVIAATNVFVCVMDFEFCDEFAEFINGTDEKQRHLVKKKAEERKHLVSLKKTD